MHQSPGDNYEEDAGEIPEDDDGYIPCSHCGEMMLEAADYCPSCDRWMTTEDAPAKRRPWWIIVVVVVLLASLVLSMR